ncbi:hypothetical protein GCM10023081_16180 [Arthrobacter ginkgonis]|uniref:Uncharacterized protein n=1 Tax=Arthrobacter ginkgonis TaxID=1630594 RepID=A0ABP7C452_9MICC
MLPPQELTANHAPLDVAAFSAGVPLVAPAAELAFEAVVDVGEMYDLGFGPLGHRRIVPILGGRFQGPAITGVVLPGGADRQLLRADGIRLLEAVYELRTDDGAVLSVTNRVTVDGVVAEGGYARSVVDVVAPEGPHDWLNRRVLVGTLHPLAPARQAVLVRVFVLT